MSAPSTAPSSSKKTRKPGHKSKAPPLASLTEANASVAPTEEKASQKLAKSFPDIKASKKDASKASKGMCCISAVRLIKYASYIFLTNTITR